MSSFILTYTSLSGKVHSTRGGYSIFSIVRNPVYKSLVNQWSIVSTLDGVELASWSRADELCNEADRMLAQREYEPLPTFGLIANDDFGLELYYKVHSAMANFFLEEARHIASRQGDLTDHAWSLHAYTANMNTARSAKCALDEIKFPHRAGLPYTFNRPSHKPMWR